MLEFVFMVCLVLIFIRVYINKFDTKGKDLISIVLAIVLTGSLYFIQFAIKFVLDLIF